jgi:hypothetical protein
MTELEFRFKHPDMTENGIALSLGLPRFFFLLYDIALVKGQESQTKALRSWHQCALT